MCHRSSADRRYICQDLPMKYYLSAPLFTASDQASINQAIASGWIAPVGPDLNKFESDLAGLTGAAGVVALSSGTAAIHLALKLAGVTKGDLVIVPTLTFAATAFPILYEGAIPLFLDVEATTGNLDVEQLELVLQQLNVKNRLPKAIMTVHLFGMPCNQAAVNALAARYEIVVIEDAAEASGSTFQGSVTGPWLPCGALADYGILSFNGNKIVTTSGGGALLTRTTEQAAQARKWATQSREPVSWYEHHETGYNYRLSNLLAAAGHSQLMRLQELVAQRRTVFDRYMASFAALGFVPQHEPDYAHSNRWLPAFKLPAETGGWQPLVTYLAENQIESRPCWKPLHLQPAFGKTNEVVYGFRLDLEYVQSEMWFEQGVCLPTGPTIDHAAQDEIIDLVKRFYLKS